MLDRPPEPPPSRADAQTLRRCEQQRAPPLSPGRAVEAQDERIIVTNGERKIEMNIVHKAILRVFWQQENEQGMQVARPWLRWLLTRAVGMKAIPARESERIQATKEQWLAVRKEAGLKIDPEKAEVFWEHGLVGDPYGVYGLTYEEDCIGRNYFARSLGTNVWVEFGDLPDAVRDRLWARLRAGDFNHDDMSWLFDDIDAGSANPAKAPANS